MGKLRDQAAYAKALLGDTGELKRVASLATLYRSDLPGEWIITALDEGGDGGIYTVVFSGPDAKERAIEYGSEKYSGLQRRD